MILIADSGSSKTDWGLIDKAGNFKYLETTGFNPYYMDSASIRDILEKDLVPLLDERSIEEVYYYGSGCSTDKKCMVVDNALFEVFSGARIVVEHDLLGAARGLFGDKEGIACILGTGSNSCHFDGIKIIENIPSTGFIYGDEGSGVYIGKRFLTAYLKNQLPEKISASFDEKYHLSLEQILDATYNQDRPIQFISSFTSFVSDHISDDYLLNIVKESFEDFLHHQVFRYSRYREVPIGFTGSIAFVFKNILEGILKKYNLDIEVIIRKPIEGLTKYHKPRVQGSEF